MEKVGPIIFAGAIGGGLILWNDHSTLRAEFTTLAADYKEFRDAGSRCTGEDCRVLNERIARVERREQAFAESYREHVAWGQQWVKGADRRLERIERDVEELEKANRYYGRDGLWESD